MSEEINVQNSRLMTTFPSVNGSILIKMDEQADRRSDYLEFLFKHR